MVRFLFGFETTFAPTWVGGTPYGLGALRLAGRNQGAAGARGQRAGPVRAATVREQANPVWAVPCNELPTLQKIVSRLLGLVV